MIISANTPSKLSTDNGGMILDGGLLLVGIAVSWENRDAYYIALFEWPFYTGFTV